MSASPTGGVKPFSIAGRIRDTRQRCLGMTDEERRWRAQWLKDQILTSEEPRDVPEYYRQTTNFFRRLWKTPMFKLQCALEPSMGQSGAYFVRHCVGKVTMIMSFLYVFTYFIKYNTNDFTTSPNKVEFYITQPRMYPHEPGYPNFPVKSAQEYYDQGFYSSVLCQDVEDVEDIERIEEISETISTAVEILPSTTPCPHPEKKN